MDTAFHDPHRPLVLTFAAVYPGDPIFKPAVQQAEMTVPAGNTECAAASLTAIQGWSYHERDMISPTSDIPQTVLLPELQGIIFHLI